MLTNFKQEAIAHIAKWLSQTIEIKNIRILDASINFFLPLLPNFFADRTHIIL